MVSRKQLNIQEIRELGNDGTLFYFTIVPEFAVNNVEVTSGSVCIPNQEIAADYIAVIVPLKK